MNTLYVAWQDSTTREWIPVAKLERSLEGFQLSYTAGARRAQGFNGLARMNDLSERYESPTLFAAFENRIISKSRPEYSDYLRWTALSQATVDPLEILAITGGTRGTDSLELFPLPEITQEGGWSVDFFLRGIRHLPEQATPALQQLQQNDKLFLMLDLQNEVDGKAIAVRTASPAALVGYCPRYYCAYIQHAHRPGVEFTLTAKRVNLDAPTSMRLLCSLRATGLDVDLQLPGDLQPY